MPVKVEEEKQPQLKNINVKKKRCLIANDDSIQLMVLELLMTQQNFEVVTVENGYEAFLGVKKTLNNPELLFDIIILDINMPICDGNNACKQIVALYEG